MEQKLSALIVDDEENARILLNKLLEETLLFDDIRVTQSVSAAYIELSRFEPDIIHLLKPVDRKETTISLVRDHNQ